jgi:hypothetical protein
MGGRLEFVGYGVDSSIVFGLVDFSTLIYGRRHYSEFK